MIDNFPTQLSFVFPLYNEQDRFQESFKTIIKYYEKYPNWEVIFVNDGSTDKTKEMVQEKIKQNKRMKLISYKKNKGKGYAIKKGMINATKPLILFSDIDFSTPLSELELLYPFIKKGADVVIGTRKVKGANITKRQSGIREWMGKCFTTITNLWLGLNQSDFTCGFKMFTSKSSKKIFSSCRVDRWGFDAEILFLANLYKFKIVDVPIEWKNDERTRVNLVQDTLRSLHDLWMIRWNWLMRKY